LAGLYNLPAVSSLKYYWHTFCILICFKETIMSLQSVEAKLLAAKELVRQTLITITNAQKELQTQYYALQTEIDNLHSETQSASIQTQSAPVQTQSASIQTQPAPVQTQSAPVPQANSNRYIPTEQEIQTYIEEEKQVRTQQCNAVLAILCPQDANGNLIIPKESEKAINVYIWSLRRGIAYKQAVIDVFEYAVEKLSPTHKAALIKQNRYLKNSQTNREIADALYADLHQDASFLLHSKTENIITSDTYKKYHKENPHRPVQTQSVTPQPVTPQPVTPQVSPTPPPQPVTPQPKPELPKLLLIKRCGAMFLYQDMNGVIVAKKDLLPQPEGIKPVPESVSELNPDNLVGEYGTEGATKILERYSLEQLQKVCTGDKYVIKQDIQGLSKEKLINLLVRTAETRLYQGETLIKNS